MNQRGAREHQLLQNVRKSAECFAEATKKPIPENLELEEPENYEKPEMLSYGCAAPDLPGKTAPSGANIQIVLSVICGLILLQDLKHLKHFSGAKYSLIKK